MFNNKCCFSFYITTNSTKNVLYCGMTNDLAQRVTEHYISRGTQKSFAGKYYCYWLIYYEHYKYVQDAIAREKEVKKWNRKKKIKMIDDFNPDWRFMNTEICEVWPPKNYFTGRFFNS